MSDSGDRLRQIDSLVDSLEHALEAAYSGSAEHGSFLRRGGGEYVPSVFLTIAELRAALATERAALQQPERVEYDPHPDCPRCKGTGECDNAQFRCICRWHQRGCPLVHRGKNCTCKAERTAVPNAKDSGQPYQGCAHGWGEPADCPCAFCRGKAERAARAPEPPPKDGVRTAQEIAAEMRAEVGRIGRDFDQEKTRE